MVKRYLRVLAGVIALSMMSWAQAPTPAPAPDQTPAPAQTPAPDQTPAAQTANIPAPTQQAAVAGPQYPRLELFAGGSYAEAGLFNAGHWAGLPGWDASLGLNATHWLGFVVEGGQYYGTSKIPTAAPEPFPPCPNSFCPGTSPTFNVKTREYNVLFGVQFARRKYERWTPIGELLYGHQGTRGIATGSGATDTEVGSGRALVAGGGLDYKINPRFAVRFKADYFQTASQFPTFAKKKQDNFRFSVGIVIRSVHKKKRKLEEETQPEP
jgi:Outer membrane protein beta-barrel domain